MFEQGLVWGATGHRPDKLGGWNPDNALRKWVRQQIKQYLVSYAPRGVISGMAQGVDQDFAWEAWRLGIPFVAAVPFKGQERAWPIQAQNAYRDLLRNAAKVVYVSSGRYSPEKMQIRNKWMVDNSDVMLAVWDGSPGGTGNCVAYIEQVGRRMAHVLPPRTVSGVLRGLGAPDDRPVD